MRFLLAVTGTVAALAACAAEPLPADARVLLRSNHLAVLEDAYAIAHGMATAYATTSSAAPTAVMRLRRLDARAAQAVAALRHVPGSDAQRQVAAQAVAALADFENGLSLVSR
jgi:hypothetical protein